MKKYLLFTTLFLFFSSYSFCFSAKNDTKSDSLFDVGEFRLCIKSLNFNDNLLKYEIKILQSECYLRLGDLDSADIILNSLDSKLINEQKNSNFLNCKLMSLQAMILLQKGFSDQAIEKLNRANQLLSNQLSDLSAQLYSNLSIVYMVQGNVETSLEYATKSISIAESIYQNAPIKLASFYNNLGLVYDAMDNNVLALESYTKAFDIYSKKYTYFHPSIAIAYNNIALIKSKENKILEAKSLLFKALGIRIKLYGANHPNIGFLYTNLARIYQKAENYDSSMYYIQKSKYIYELDYGKKHPELATVLNLESSLLLKQNLYKKAIDASHKAVLANTKQFSSTNIYAVPYSNDYISATILLYSLYEKAQALTNLYNNKTLNVKYLTNAFTILTTCDTLIDKNRQIRIGKNDKLELNKIAADIYELAVSNCLLLAEVGLMKEHYWHKAFYFSEKSKASILMGAIAETNAKKYAGIPDNLLSKENDLKTKVSYFENKLSTSLVDNKKYVDSLFFFKKIYSDLIKKLEIEYPAYYKLKYDVKIVSIDELKNKLKMDETIISYFISNNTNRIIVFEISKNKFKVHNFPLDVYFERTIKGLKNGVLFREFDLFEKYSYSLYKQIFNFKLSNTTKKLIIIPDGILGAIPFELLITEKQKGKPNYQTLSYLLKKYEFSYNYSSTLYYHTVSSTQSNTNQFLFCAPVSFTNYRNLTVRKNLVTLDGSLQEVNQICDSVLNNLSTTKLLNSNASELEFKKLNLLNYNYIHFATHGLVDSNKPELSRIYFAEDKNFAEDACLYTGEIYNLALNADLVMMSACQTGQGKISKGEGVIGLSRSLIYAGAKNVGVSLWSVSDESTSLLMQNFYKQLKNSANFSSNMKFSKLNLINSGIYSAPYFWAPFIIIGN